MITSWLEGFGATATYSRTTSNIELPYTIGRNPTQAPISGSVSMQLPGLSKDNRSITLYYERAGFSAFVASSHRSTYIGSVANNTTGGYPALAQIDPQTWVSAQVGYEFQSGIAKGLGIRFEGNNMNKPVYRDFNGSNTNSNETGAFYGFKLTYKLQ
jgi:iron complex outermembrane receptor protein